MQPSTRPLLAVDATPGAIATAVADAWDGGPAVLPLDPRMPPRLKGAMVADAKPGAAVKPGGLVTLPYGLDVPGDVVAVVPTSGSTGHPKQVQLTRAGLEASVRAGLARTEADPDVPWLCCLPVSHVGGLLVVLRGIVTGTPTILQDGFDVDAVLGVADRVHLAVVPTMLRRLLDAGADPTRWATVLVGGARMPEDLRERVPQAVSTYGMTETSGGCVYDGVPLDGVEVQIAADGRVRLGGSTLMRGYHRPGGPGTADVIPAGGGPGDQLLRHGIEDGLFTTADVGDLDADGHLQVLGRADDVIVTGGEKVVAEQVAARLERHPAIAEAAVIGVPDPEWGQRVVAVVVPDEVGAIMSLALLRTFVSDELPRYAAPKDLVVVNQLPRLANGKVDRQALITHATST